MKAFLLAAGLGTRLRPITNDIPKCLVPIAGKPLISYWLDLFYRHHITEVLINLHYHPRQVEAYLKTDRSGVMIHPFYEEELLGSAGTVKANREWVGGDKQFVIAYADNLTNVDLTKMIGFHNEQGSPFTMGLFRAERPSECGIAELDPSNLVVSFTEKPAVPKSNLANAGLYIASAAVFDYIPEKRPADFGFDVLPNLVGKMKGYILQEYLLDIGTLQNFQQAQKEVYTYKLLKDRE